MGIETESQQGTPGKPLNWLRLPWLHVYAVVTAIGCLTLLCVGGLVTSHGVGMSVPDWPTTYGYNMFAFPFSHWVGGIFYEHSHRLIASLVGLLVVGLTRWLGGTHSRLPLAMVGGLEVIVGMGLLQGVPGLKGTGHFLAGIGGVVLVAALVWVRNSPAPKPLPTLGWVAFGAVHLIGLLGGLRVVLLKDELGVFHATLAQLFFVLVSGIALLTSPWWRRLTAKDFAALQPSRFLRRLALATTLLILGQLVIGATMRHQHAGLAIPDFPLAYGKLWPVTDPASIASYNQRRIEVTAVNPITAFQVWLQMVHRAVAIVILGAVITWAVVSRRHLGGKNPLRFLGLLWLGLVLVQVGLGAFTIWTNKAADVATLHMLAGALTLAFGAMLSLLSFPDVAIHYRRDVAQESVYAALNPPASAATGAQG